MANCHGVSESAHTDHRRCKYIRKELSIFSPNWILRKQLTAVGLFLYIVQRIGTLLSERTS